MGCSKARVKCQNLDNHKKSGEKLATRYGNVIRADVKALIAPTKLNILLILKYVTLIILNPVKTLLINFQIYVFYAAGATS